MMDKTDIIGVVRDHRWIKAVEQRKRLSADGCRVIVELNGGSSQADLERLTRPGTVLKLVHAFLLADPNTNQRGGVKASFDAYLKALTEKRGGIVKDMETGLTTEKAEHRKAIVAVAYAHITRSNQGRKSQLNGARSRGRPKAWTDERVRQIIWDEWHSTAHKTNVDAVKAASERIGRKVYYHTMWRVVREMRRERGMPDAGGASGRLPGNPAIRPDGRRKRRSVYFMLCGKNVKIGVATKVNSRLSHVQTGSAETIKLLRCMPGDESLEKKLHKKFAGLHVRGEWFRYEGELREYIQSLPKCRPNR